MKIPYGIHDYKTIITDDYLYIDKTMFIDKIENLGKYLVFLRPRRFGKSLFTSMLYYYYDINNADNYKTLFGNSYIGSNKTTEANSYYVLKYDFSGISTEKDMIRNSFFRKVVNGIESFINRYKININIDSSINEANEYADSFFAEYESKYDKQIYLIIDEYDHFANNVLTSDLNLFNMITGKDGFVRSFYEVLKTYAGTTISRIFITGVTPITLDSLTSGFNMASDVTKEEELNEMLGFTENEVISILKDCKINKDYLSTLKDNYNGYLFHETSKMKMYNSNMVLYYVKPFTLRNNPPSSLTDPNMLSDYTKITGMFDLYKDEGDKKEIIHKILKNEAITTAITEKFNLKLEFNKEQFLSIMYYLGLLTIENSYGGEVGLRTPNYIIKNIYYQYYYYYLNKELNMKYDVRNVKDAIRELSMHNKPEQFIYMLEKFLKEISNRDFIKFDEKYIKLLMLTYLRLSDLYLVKSEYEINGKYIDIALLPNRLYELYHYFIFEIKYISRTNYSEDLLIKKRNEAVNQINEYAKCEEMKSINNLKKYIFIFVQDECKVAELIL